MEAEIKDAVDNSKNGVSFDTNTDAELRIWFLAEIDSNVDVSVSDLEKYFLYTQPSIWTDIKTAATAEALALIELFGSNINEIDITNTEFVRQLDALIVTVTAFTATEKAEITALGTQKAPRYQTLGLKKPAPDEINMARAL